MPAILTTKTFWVGLAGLLSAVGGYATGDLSAAAALQTGLTSVLGWTLRDGILKG